MSGSQSPPASGPQQGFQTPNSSAGPFNAVAFLVKQLIGTVGTMIPVEVVGSSGSGLIAAPGTVNVVPAVSQINGAGAPTPHGTIFNVPVWRLQGGTGAIILDPVVGDIGLAFVAMRDISVLKSTKARSNPGSFRRYDLADSIYVGAILGDAPAQYIQFLPGGGINLADSFGNTIHTASAGITINGVLIDRSGNLGAPGEITRGAGGGSSVTLGGHTHHQGVDSHGDTEAPTDAPTAGT